MAFNGNGVFNRIHNWVQDALNGINITDARMDGEDDGFAAGLTNCVTRDGQSPATADLPMGGFKHTNIAAAAARSEYASLGQAQDNAYTFAGTVAGTADAITFGLTPAITAYVPGQMFTFVAGAANTGAVTLNVNAVGVKNVLANDGSALVAGNIRNGQAVTVIYDGTQFQLQNRVGAVGSQLSTQIFTTPGAGTYIPTAGTRTAIARMVGGGGSSGANVGGASVGGPGGGGAGAYAEVVLASPNPAGVAYTIGAGAAAPGSTSGTAGTATVFNGVTAGAGQGGQVGNTSAGTPTVSIGGAGGTVSGGSPRLSIDGEAGGDGMYVQNGGTGLFAIGGKGGDSMLGLGGAQRLTLTSNTANAATGYGSGGGAPAKVATSGSAIAGGAGRDGILIIDEYA